MTATTKEQRAAASIYIEKHTALQATFPADFVLALLNDSERLAAIEAVTGEEVRELVGRLNRYQADYNGDEACVDIAATALISLSAKVAEQAEEVERLKTRAQEVWDERNQILRDSGYTQFDLIKRAEAAEAERDTLRRLLTAMAVPALEKIKGRDSYIQAAAGADRMVIGGQFANIADEALSTIHTQMEG